MGSDLENAQAKFNETVAVSGEVDEDALRKMCEAASAQRAAKRGVLMQGYSGTVPPHRDGDW